MIGTMDTLFFEEVAQQGPIAGLLLLAVGLLWRHVSRALDECAAERRRCQEELANLSKVILEWTKEQSSQR